MKNRRGFGFIYQPKYRDRRTGEQKTCATCGSAFPSAVSAIRENAQSTNDTVAKQLLKQRLGEAAIGKPVGASVERTTLDDLLAMIEADYIAEKRRSLKRA